MSNETSGHYEEEEIEAALAEKNTFSENFSVERITGFTLLVPKNKKARSWAGKYLLDALWSKSKEGKEAVIFDDERYLIPIILELANDEAPGLDEL